MMFINSRLSDYRVKKTIECFCLDIDATKTALLLKLNRKTINRYFKTFRLLIHDYQIRQMKEFIGIIEVDERFFGATRIRGKAILRKRGRGTLKQPVFGIYERNGRVYTEIVPDCSARSLQSIIRGKVSLESIIHSDGWKGYDGLVDVGYDRHLRVNKSKSFVEHGVFINSIEAFWSFTKRRLTKFNGVKANFHLHLKECEWRYKKDVIKLQSELMALSKKSTLMV